MYENLKCDGPQFFREPTLCTIHDPRTNEAKLVRTSAFLRSILFVPSPHDTPSQSTNIYIRCFLRNVKDTSGFYLTNRSMPFFSNGILIHTCEWSTAYYHPSPTSPLSQLLQLVLVALDLKVPVLTVFHNIIRQLTHHFYCVHAGLVVRYSLPFRNPTP